MKATKSTRPGAAKAPAFSRRGWMDFLSTTLCNMGSGRPLAQAPFLPPADPVESRRKEVFMTHRKQEGVLIALALLSGVMVGVAAFSASLIPPLGPGLKQGLPSHREGAAPRPEGAGIPRIGPEEAAALALNELSETAEGVRLRHPRYHAQFTEAGVRVEPRRGALRWQWRLEEVTGRRQAPGGGARGRGPAPLLEGEGGHEGALPARARAGAVRGGSSQP